MHLSLSSIGGTREEQLCILSAALLWGVVAWLFTMRGARKTNNNITANDNNLEAPLLEDEPKHAIRSRVRLAALRAMRLMEPELGEEHRWSERVRVAAQENKERREARAREAAEREEREWRLAVERDVAPAAVRGRPRAEERLGLVEALLGGRVRIPINIFTNG